MPAAVPAAVPSKHPYDLERVHLFIKVEARDEEIVEPVHRQRRCEVRRLRRLVLSPSAAPSAAPVDEADAARETERR